MSVFLQSSVRVALERLSFRSHFGPVSFPWPRSHSRSFFRALETLIVEVLEVGATQENKSFVPTVVVIVLVSLEVAVVIEEQDPPVFDSVWFAFMAAELWLQNQETSAVNDVDLEAQRKLSSSSRIRPTRMDLPGLCRAAP